MSQLFWIIPLIILGGLVAILVGLWLGTMLFKLGELTGINKLIYKYLDWLGF